MINQLTADQEQRLQIYREKAINLSTFNLSTFTGIYSQSEVEEAVDECYECAGLPLPAEKIWVASPLQAQEYISQFAYRDKMVGLTVRNQLALGTGLTAESAVQEQINGTTWNDVRHAMMSAQYEDMRLGLLDQAWDQLKHYVARKIIEEKQLRGVHEPCYYPVYIGGLCFYQFWAEQCGLNKEVQPLLGLIHLMEAHCGWMYAFERSVILVGPPLVLILDDTGSLHNARGPAVVYKDGFQIYAYEGKILNKEED